MSDEEKALLENLCEKIEIFREVDMREPLECIVIEKDWPEYDHTLKILTQRIKKDIIHINIVQKGEELWW